MLAPPRLPATRFSLVRYFIVASLAVFLPVAATLLYFDFQKNNLFRRVQQQQEAFFAQMQDSFVQRHDAAAPAYLLRVYEAGNVNLTRLFANSLWDKDFGPFVAKAQRIPVDQCRAIADVKDAGGATVPPREKQACYTGTGRQIMALPEFRTLDRKVFDLVKKSTVLKIKLYDLRGITVYSSEHNQIGEDDLGNPGWKSAMAGKPASQLTHRGKFTAFEGEVANRDVISSYVPVLAPGNERIVAVFEVYSDITQFVAQIKGTASEIQALSAANRTQLERAAAANQDKVNANANLMLALVVGMLALLYCALFLIVRNAQRLIDKQDLERHQAGLALARQKDLYDMLSHVNQAIVRIVERDELFAIVCRVAVEHGRFRFAWIGLVDETDQRVKVVARHGEDAGYVDQASVSSAPSDPRALGPTGQALRSGRNAFSNDFLNDPATAPWHDAARRAGVLASAAFPIYEGGALLGTINLYADEPGFFNEGLLATLDEISQDVSFALDNFARDAALKRTIGALQDSEDKLRAIFESATDGILVVDLETGKFLIGNPAICRALGYTIEEIVRLGVADIHPEQDLPRVMEQFERQRRGESQMATDIPVKRKDGSVFYADIKTAPIRLGGKDGLLGVFRDSTERRRAQEELRTAAERLRLHVELTPLGVIEWDAYFRVVSWNRSAERIFGYAAVESLGRHASFILPTGARESVDQVWSGLLSGRGGDRSINENITKDGRTILCEWHNTRLTRSDGNLMGVASLVEDITERKEMEGKLKDSVAFRELLLQAMPLPVFHKDALGRYTGCNRAFTEFLGKAENDIVGKTVYEVSPQSFAQNYRDKDLELLDDPAGMQVYESRVMHADGTAHDVIFHKARIVDTAGRPTGIVGAIADITESKRAQEALREAEAQFHGLVEQSIAGIYIIQDGKFAYVNPRFAEIRGYSSADEIVGRDPLQLVDEKVRETIAENNRQLLAGKILSIGYSFGALRKDGSSVEIGAHSALATYRGRPAIIGLMQDISEKRRAEEQIQHYIAQLENAFMQSVEVATTLSEMRDPYTAGHERRVAEIAVAISAELGFDARRQEGLRVAGYLHDIGKITVPAEILSKPTKLTPIEYQLIQGHAQASYEVLKNVDFPWPVAQIALQHHERIDGSGYPQGLKGDAILFEARILAVADTIEAMSSHRPYRPGLGIEKSLAEIERGRGTAYDTNVADACLKLFREKGYAIPV